MEISWRRWTTLVQLQVLSCLVGCGLTHAACKPEHIAVCRNAAIEGKIGTLEGGGSCKPDRYYNHYTHNCFVNSYLPHVEFCCCQLRHSAMCCRYHQYWDHFRCNQAKDTLSNMPWLPDRTGDNNASGPSHSLPLEILLPAILVPLVVLLVCAACCGYYCCYKGRRKEEKKKKLSKKFKATSGESNPGSMTPDICIHQSGDRSHEESFPLSSMEPDAEEDVYEDTNITKTMPPGRDHAEPSAPPIADLDDNPHQNYPPRFADTGIPYTEFPEHPLPRSDSGIGSQGATEGQMSVAGNVAPPTYEESLHHPMAPGPV